MASSKTLNVDFALVKIIYARQALDQRGFPGAVFAHQGVNLTFVQRKIHVVKGFYSRETSC